jgi:hypothetical protein
MGCLYDVRVQIQSSVLFKQIVTDPTRLMGVVSSYKGLLVARFFLGVAEVSSCG